MDTDLYRIVGVMPSGFDAPGRTAEERNIEIWAATSFYGAPMDDHPRRSGRNLPTAIARLKPGLTDCSGAETDRRSCRIRYKNNFQRITRSKMRGGFSWCR